MGSSTQDEKDNLAEAGIPGKISNFTKFWKIFGEVCHFFVKSVLCFKKIDKFLELNKSELRKR